MFKDRFFLNGLGIGMIIGALLLQLMNVSAVPKDNMAAANVDDSGKPAERIIAMKQNLQSLGFKIYDQGEKLYTQEQLDQAIEREKSGRPNRTVQSPTPEPTTSPSMAASLNSESSSTDTQKPVWSFVIPQGMGSDQLGDLLVEKKFIEDKETLSAELNKRHLEASIRAGNYVFDHKPSLSALIQAITSGQ